VQSHPPGWFLSLGFCSSGGERGAASRLSRLGGWPAALDDALLELSGSDAAEAPVALGKRRCAYNTTRLQGVDQRGSSDELTRMVPVRGIPFGREGARHSSSE